MDMLIYALSKQTEEMQSIREQTIFYIDKEYRSLLNAFKTGAYPDAPTDLNGAIDMCFDSDRYVKAFVNGVILAVGIAYTNRDAVKQLSSDLIRYCTEKGHETLHEAEKMFEDTDIQEE